MYLTLCFQLLLSFPSAGIFQIKGSASHFEELLYFTATALSHQLLGFWQLFLFIRGRSGL